MAGAGENRCLLRGLARAQDQSALYDVLDDAVIGPGDLMKTVYFCSRCAFAATVEYPPIGNMPKLDGMALHIEDDGKDCLDFDVSDDEVKALSERFPETKPLSY